MTTEERLENVERELARAKRRNRWLLAAVLLAEGVCLLAGALTVGTTPTGQVPQVALKEVRASRFVLEDANGKTRAMLRVAKDGPALALFDENGNSRAILMEAKDGPRLTLTDENGNPRALLGALKDRVALELVDENFKSRALLVVDKDGPSLGLADENGKTRASFGSDQTTTPDGKRIIHPESSMRLFNPAGKVIWSAP